MGPSSALRSLAITLGLIALVGASAASPVPITGGVHEALTMALGDTVLPGYSIRSDTILVGIPKARIAVRACGQSTICLRIYRGATAIALTADTIDLTAPCSYAPGVAVRIKILTQPSNSAAVGSVFARQPAAQIVDANNNPVHQAGVPITVNVATGGGTLNGTRVAYTDSMGIARFTNLSIAGTSSVVGVHEVLEAAVHDTITPNLAVRNSGILGIVGQRVVAKKCGGSFIYLRTYDNKNVMRTADTVAVTVPCPAP